MEHIEEWRPVTGYPLYEVSSQGRVRNIKSHKVLAPCTHKDDFVCVSLSLNGKPTAYTVHRLVAEAFLANPEGKRWVKHIDESRINNAVTNLEWITPTESAVEFHKVTSVLIDPQGMRHITNNLCGFCMTHDLNKGNLYKVRQGKCKQHKGWKLL